jgi:glycine betaine/proline transport system substrate-binding protein
MKKLLLMASVATGVMAFAGNASADCGNITIASMTWQSAEVLAYLDKFILNEGYGCNADVIMGDTVPTITSMVEKGEPDLAPEGWIDLLPDVVSKGLDEGKIVSGAWSLSDGGVQGWWIPKYVADAHPDIKTIDDALKHPELFPAPEDPSKGAVHNGPQGWGGTLVTTQLFKAYEAEKAGFVLVDSGSAAGHDGSIAKAYERQQGWLGFYWAPTALLGKYEMVKLDHGVPYDEAEWKRCNTVADCPDRQAFRRTRRQGRARLSQQAFVDQRHGQQADGLDDRQPGDWRGRRQALPKGTSGNLESLGDAASGRKDRSGSLRPV